MPWLPSITGHTVNGFPVAKTESIILEASDAGHFSQNVTTTVYWNQDDNEKPTGDYLGVIKLMALIPPQI